MDIRSAPPPARGAAATPASLDAAEVTLDESLRLSERACPCEMRGAFIRRSGCTLRVDAHRAPVAAKATGGWLGAGKHRKGSPRSCGRRKWSGRSPVGRMPPQISVRGVATAGTFTHRRGCQSRARRNVGNREQIAAPVSRGKKPQFLGEICELVLLPGAFCSPILTDSREILKAKEALSIICVEVRLSVTGIAIPGSFVVTGRAWRKTRWHIEQAPNPVCLQ